jgi:hypothetical protein
MHMITEFENYVNKRNSYLFVDGGLGAESPPYKNFPLSHWVGEGGERLYMGAEGKVYFSESFARISIRLILPLIVFGSSGTNSIARGYL